jgi:hypothetical protein
VIDFDRLYPINFYTASNKKLNDLRKLKPSLAPVSTPINLLYDEIIKRAQENNVRSKEELNVI